MRDQRGGSEFGPAPSGDHVAPRLAMSSYARRAKARADYHSLGPMSRSEELNEQGRALDRKGDSGGAEAAYRAAIEADPNWFVPYYNLGLLYKYQARWQESLDWNRRAAALDPSDGDTWWNLGIAATAVGDWKEARRAWERCGMQVPPGDGPPDFNFGSIPVRLDPNGDAEVVWAHRIDPARAELLSVPLPSSPYNAGAIVLTDGAVDGIRKVGDREYPVFNVLAVLKPSLLGKYVIELATLDKAAIDELERLAADMGGAAENWGRSTNIMCAKCSRGVPHQHPRREGAPAHPHCGLAARDDTHAEEIIGAWLQQSANADLIRWYDASATPPN